MKKKVNEVETPTIPSINRAWTEEGRRNQLIGEAYDLVEKRLREGTATSQETVFFLKLGAQQTKLEEEKLKAEVALAKAKVDAINDSKELLKKSEEAMRMMREYRGDTDEDVF